jgi:hypothetical protein
MSEVSMAPGRTLDVAIAEKVMGWTVLSAIAGKEHVILGVMKSAIPKHPTGPIVAEVENQGPLPHFSTDPNVMWDIVNKVDLFNGRALFRNNGKFVVTSIVPTRVLGPDEYIGESASHAVCLAALVCVGVKL